MDLSKELYDQFKSQNLARLGEQYGVLPKEWLEIIYQKKWFKFFVPRSLGGLQLSLPEALKMEEGLARVDASLGWTLTLCSGAAWFVGFFEKSLREEVFSNPKVCLAGSGFVGGKAQRTKNGFSISGKWTYASGALHATHFTANCEIYKNERPVLDGRGDPLVKAFILKKSEVVILDVWDYMGMKATGSHAFETDKLEVSANRCFEISPEKTQLDMPIYRYPFLQFAETTLSVNILGISLHLQELIHRAFEERNSRKPYSPKQVAYFRKLEEESNSKLSEHSDYFYELVEESWNELENKGEIEEKTLKKVSKTSRKLTQVCREQNAILYPFSGIAGARSNTELNRAWRDFNTVSQHSLLIFPF